MPHQIPATGGTPPYTFAITGGSLPPGLTMSAAGLISGTPTAAGTFTFTVTVTDAAAATASVTCSIVIRPKEYFNGSSEQLICDPRYPWLLPPTARIPKYLHGSIAAPVQGVLSLIFQFQVPEGYWLVIDQNMCAYTGTGFVEGSGGIIWGIDINVPLAQAQLTGRPVAQFISSTGNLQRMVKVGPLLIKGGDMIRYKVIVTDPAVAVGPPNFVHAALAGWLYPLARNL